jgi:hypothetical protein
MSNRINAVNQLYEISFHTSEEHAFFNIDCNATGHKHGMGFCLSSEDAREFLLSCLSELENKK